MHVISVKKNVPSEKPEREKRPRTELDVKFLAAVEELMAQRGIRSDRAISIALGRTPDFINRVRNGFQSATPEAWDVLLKASPEGTSISQSQVTGIAVGINNGIAAHTYAMADCEKERDEARAERDALKKESESLREQLAAKDALLAAKDDIIAAKEEMLVLLRGSKNRPN